MWLLVLLSFFYIFLIRISGVPIALGAIRLLKPIYILEDHNCMHIDFEVQMIVLK